MLNFIIKTNCWVFLNSLSAVFVWIALGGEDALSKLVFVDITPCDPQPCELKKGTEEVVEVQFVPSKNTEFIFVVGWVHELSSL